VNRVEEFARLDWGHASVGDPKPCVLCGTNAHMRHPQTGRPCHKTCSDARRLALIEQAARTATGARTRVLEGAP
jgi:hypothetical protein